MTKKEVDKVNKEHQELMKWIDENSTKLHERFVFMESMTNTQSEKFFIFCKWIYKGGKKLK